MSASGMRAATPTHIEASARAMNADIRIHVTSTTTRTTPSKAMISRRMGSTGLM
jgi:hypothetical protein